MDKELNGKNPKIEKVPKKKLYKAFFDWLLYGKGTVREDWTPVEQIVKDKTDQTKEILKAISK
ncbi:MAG: hypothetical protein GDA46_01470 [Bdellovibrionales bacterium]|nr:hypothetical protein [Bdellovibrionales bacterium]